MIQGAIRRIAPSERRTDKPLNILLVDDNPEKLLTYRAILDDLGETLLEARSGHEALDCLLRQPVAVVVTDVLMPDIDGFALAHLIRDHPRFSKTAIIFVSAVLSQESHRLRGYELGGVDFISVPIEPAVMRARVRVFADLYRKTHGLEEANHALERRVAERTAELAAINRELTRRIDEGTRELLAARERLQQAQKLEAIGQLAGGVAHWLNNLLMVIRGSIELFLRRHGSDAPGIPMLTRALDAVDRGAWLTGSLLSFAHRKPVQPSLIDINAALAAHVDIFRSAAGEKADVALELGPEGSLPTSASWWPP